MATSPRETGPRTLPLRSEGRTPLWAAMPEPLDIHDLTKAFSSFATGITVVTTRDEAGNPVGITCNSFTSISLEPPLLLFSLARTAFSLAAFRRADHFGVSVLAAGQEAVSRRFATPLTDKWAGVDWHDWDRGSPIIIGAVAGFECRTIATYEAGDHVIFIGEIERMESRDDRTPLVYLRRRYGHFAPQDHHSQDHRPEDRPSPDRHPRDRHPRDRQGGS